MREPSTPLPWKALSSCRWIGAEVVKGIDSREKRYVKVASVTDEDGRITPVSVEWEDGHIYEIDRVIDRRQAASLKVGGIGMRYLVRIGQSTTYLFHEDPRWYVEAKCRS